MLPVEHLRELIELRLDGVIAWRVRQPEHWRGPEYLRERWNSRNAGQPALTCVAATGYFVGTIYGRFYLAHRVIWALTHGEWPEKEIDHINGNRTDNRIENLRSVPHSENAKNRGRSPGHDGELFGVRLKANRWEATIKVNGKNVYLGRFKDKADATAARCAAEIAAGYHGNHGRRVTSYAA